MNSNVNQRMCVSCRMRAKKNQLIRFVFTNDGIKLDETQKFNARGFYICNNKTCATMVIKNKAIMRRLNRNITETEKEHIISSVKI